MKKKQPKKYQGAFHKNLETMTNKRILEMRILDSEKHIRLLQDAESGFYVVFNGRFNQTHYAKSYQKAEKHFLHLIAIS
jgi:hypothetical protein